MLVVVAALVVSGRLGASDLMPLSFDSPFVETPIKRVVDSCMRLWGDLEFLASGRVDVRDRDAMVEAAIGRAAFVGWSVDRFVHAGYVEEAVGDGLQYICHAADQMGELSRKIPANDEHATCMHSFLRRIQRKLNCSVADASLESYDAAISAGQ